MSKIIKSSRVVDNYDNKNQKISNRRNISWDDNHEKNIENNNEKYDEIIKKAELEAEKIREEAQDEILKLEVKTKEEAHKLGYSDGHELGFKEGKEKAEDQLRASIDEVLSFKEDLLVEKDRLLSNLERQTIELVIEILDRLVTYKIEDKEYITELVSNGLKKIDPTDKLVIYSSKEDYETLEESRDLILAQGSMIEELEIKYDINMKKGDCILETKKGSLDLDLL